jgi:hypothetical protein
MHTNRAKLLPATPSKRSRDSFGARGVRGAELRRVTRPRLDQTRNVTLRCFQSFVRNTGSRNQSAGRTGTRYLLFVTYRLLSTSSRSKNDHSAAGSVAEPVSTGGAWMCSARSESLRQTVNFHSVPQCTIHLSIHSARTSPTKTKVSATFYPAPKIGGSDVGNGWGKERPPVSR